MAQIQGADSVSHARDQRHRRLLPWDSDSGSNCLQPPAACFAASPPTNHMAGKVYMSVSETGYCQTKGKDKLGGETSQLGSPSPHQNLYKSQQEILAHQRPNKQGLCLRVPPQLVLSWPLTEIPIRLSPQRPSALPPGAPTSEKVVRGPPGR